MNTGEHLAALVQAELARSRLSELLNHKFSSPQLVNNFNVLLEPAFTAYRDHCLDAVFPTISDPSVPELLLTLWDMHTRVRSKFVQALSKLSPHHHQAPSKPYRDTAKEFLAFIKAAQAFYKTILRRLHDHCPHITVLGTIAKQYLNGNLQGPLLQENPYYKTEEARNAAVAITRDSLIYLGDLSRWRHKAHVDSRSNTPQWKMARLYYELGYEVDPASGLAKHQLAVLAQDDYKYFPALASLYQSLASAHPHPQAANNLERLLTRHLNVPFSQILPKVKPSEDENNVIGTLRAWFLQLHVRFYKGVLFDKHGEMESEVLNRIAQALKDGTDLDSTLLPMVLINMAAEWTALENAKQGLRARENAQMYFFVFHHNVKTFKTLMEHVHDQLEAKSRTSYDAMGPEATAPIASSAALQSLRVYVLWFSVNWTFMQQCIENNHPDPETAEDVRHLWRLISHVLNGIASLYPPVEVGTVSQCEHLVDEEEATMGFLPVQTDTTREVWWQDGALKPVIRRERTSAEVAEYDLVRVRDIYTRLLRVAANEKSSLVVVDNKVVFNESGIISPPPPSIIGEKPVTPPQTATGLLNTSLQAQVADEVSTQDLQQKTRKRIPLRMQEPSDSVSLHATAAVEPMYEFPTPFPWIPTLEQDAFWHIDHPSVTTKTPWGAFPFALSWYGFG